MMPDLGYAGRLTGAILLGLVALVVAFIAFMFMLPILLPLALGTMALVAIFAAIFGVIYLAAFIGAAIYYFFRPMEVSRKDKGYDIGTTKEAGRRQKGKTVKS